MAVLAISAVLAVPAASRALGSDRPRTVTYIVRADDTVWSIASRVAAGKDPRSVVDAIVRLNGIDPGAIVPGQELRLPA